jgi:hypothetical protein
VWGVTAFNGLALVDSVSVSIYSPSATAGPGEKIAGPIAIAIPSEGDGFFSAVATVPLDSGTYFFVVSGNAEGGVAVGAINDATSGVLGIVADSLATGYFAEVAGVPGIMPSDLTADVTAANLVNISVQVLFQITHD